MTAGAPAAPAAAPRTACVELDEFFDDELPPDRAQTCREHIVWCARCSRKLLGRMLEAAVAGS